MVLSCASKIDRPLLSVTCCVGNVFCNLAIELVTLNRQPVSRVARCQFSLYKCCMHVSLRTNACPRRLCKSLASLDAGGSIPPARSPVARSLLSA